MNYKVIKNESTNLYDIFETATEQVIMSFDKLTDARKSVRHFNLGGSFDGWTPNFFLKKIIIPKSKKNKRI
jgi:hypothetical protein